MIRADGELDPRLVGRGERRPDVPLRRPLRPSGGRLRPAADPGRAEDPSLPLPVHRHDDGRPWRECYRARPPDDPHARAAEVQDGAAARRERRVRPGDRLRDGPRRGRARRRLLRGHAQPRPVPRARRRPQHAANPRRGAGARGEVPDRPHYRLPLWELVYHDCVVAQWYWGDYNNKLPALWDRRDLFNALYGTPPMFMFNRKQWESQHDRFVQSYRTATPVARATGYAEMLSHRWLTDDHAVQETRFANGCDRDGEFRRPPAHVARRWNAPAARSPRDGHARGIGPRVAGGDWGKPGRPLRSGLAPPYTGDRPGTQLLTPSGRGGTWPCSGSRSLGADREAPRPLEVTEEGRALARPGRWAGQGSPGGRQPPTGPGSGRPRSDRLAQWAVPSRPAAWAGRAGSGGSAGLSARPRSHWPWMWSPRSSTGSSAAPGPGRNKLGVIALANGPASGGWASVPVEEWRTRFGYGNDSRQTGPLSSRFLHSDALARAGSGPRPQFERVVWDRFLLDFAQPDDPRKPQYSIYG